MNYEEIGKRIRKYRKLKNLSQEQLAEKINISTTLTMKSITVTNSSGTAVYTGSGTSASFSLSDGSYNISIKYVWTRTQRGVTTTWNYTFASSIVVDTTAPTGVIKNSSGTTLTSPSPLSIVK